MPKRDLRQVQRALLLQRRCESEEERRQEGECGRHGRSLCAWPDASIIPFGRSFPSVRRVSGVERHDLVHLLEPFRAVRDQEDGAVAGRVEHVVHERLGRRRVEVRRRLVEHEHGRVGEQGAREREALALAAREPRPVLADERVEAVGERRDPLAEPRAPERRPRARRRSRVGRASRRFSRIVESKTCASWPASANVPADVLLPVLAQRRGRRS